MNGIDVIRTHSGEALYVNMIDIEFSMMVSI